MSRTHCVGRGTGTPKEKDEVNNRVYYKLRKRELCASSYGSGFGGISENTTCVPSVPTNEVLFV